MAGMQAMTRSRIRKIINETSCPPTETDYSDATTSSVSPSSPQKKPKTPDMSAVSNHKNMVDVEDLELLGKERDDESPGVGWRPKFWRRQLYNIREMRAGKDAPVDTMGCSELADIKAEPKEQRFQVLLSLMLSSQTKDQITSAAMERLKLAGCSISDMLRYTETEIEQMLIPVSFYKRKAIYIKSTAAILRERYDDDIPTTVELLCELPGVGPKMAHLVMQVAWGQVTGIAVDTHVHRVSNRLGWVPKPTKNPEDTRKILEQWMPRELWHSTNKLLVGFGQQTCGAVKPKCGSCLNKEICPYGRSQK